MEEEGERPLSEGRGGELRAGGRGGAGVEEGGERGDLNLALGALRGWGRTGGGRQILGLVEGEGRGGGRGVAGGLGGRRGCGNVKPRTAKPSLEPPPDGALRMGTLRPPVGQQWLSSSIPAPGPGLPRWCWVDQRGWAC